MGTDAADENILLFENCISREKNFSTFVVYQKKSPHCANCG